ncbi:MAG: bacterio-opsin activator, partial [Halobaculum sp.]
MAARAEELERVNRINELVRELNAALVDTRTRSEIERAICDRLVAADEVCTAWIGEGGEDGLTTRAIAGDEAYVESQLTDPTVDDEPAMRAAETRDRVVVSDAAERLRETAWSEHALTHDVRAVASLPISTD